MPTFTQKSGIVKKLFPETFSNITAATIVALAIALTSTTRATAQPFSVMPLSMDDGLSCNYVVDIEQDHDGYLWFATDEGLNRFDGAQFHTYYKGMNGMPSSELNCLLSDIRDNAMWIGTKNDGLARLDLDTETMFTYRHVPDDPGSIATNDITHLSHAADGGIWVTTYWRGLEHFDPQTRTFTHAGTATIAGLPDNQLWCAADAGEDIVMVGHVRSGLSVIDTQSRTARNFRHSDSDKGSISGDEVNCIYRDKNGLVWVGTNHGLDLFDMTTGRFTHICANQIGDSRIYDIRQLSDGRIAIATELYGIAFLSPHSLILDHGTDRRCELLGIGKTGRSLTGNSIRAIEQDRFGNVWAGLYGGGVNCLTSSTPPFISPCDTRCGNVAHQPQTSAMCVVIANDSTIWAGTDGSGLMTYDTQLQPRKAYPTEAGTNIHAAYKDSRGLIWLGSFTHGAHVMQTTGGTTHFRAVGESTEDVRCFAESRDGTMLIGTSHGIYEVERERLSVIRHLHVGNDLVRSMAFDHAGRLWVGYFGFGIEVMKPDLSGIVKQFRSDIEGAALPSNCINHLICDKEGDIWAATNEGAVHFDLSRDGEISYSVISNEMENRHIRAIAEDGGGNIWLSTNRGISVVRQDKKVLNFDHRSGIITSNFNDGAAAFTSGGDIIMGTARGLCRFSPKRVLATNIAPAPRMTSLNIMRNFDEPDSTINLTNKSEITLDYEFNTFTVNFSTQDYATNPYVEYCYTIGGLQNEYAIADNGAVTLRNLPAGEYTLTVHSRRSNQPWNDDAATLKIKIDPPMWLSWWAKTIYAIIIVTIALLIMRAWRLRLRLKYQIQAEQDDHLRKERLNEERLRFFTNITHELRTPLTLIIGPLEDLSHEMGIPEAMRHKLAIIHQSARRLADLINQTLEFRKTETNNRQLKVKKANIVDSIREVALKYEELSQKADVTFRFVAPEHDVTMYFDPEVIRICADNIISNAIKYTDRGSIDVCVQRHTEAGRRLVEIAISDTGCGISAKALPHIFDRYYQERGAHQASGTGIGLALTKNLIDLHHGTISVKSKQGEGTTFVISLSEDEIYPDALHAPQDDGAQAPSDSEESREQGDESDKRKGGERLTILAVEDNKDILDYIRSSFADEFDVLTATNGSEGLATALDHEPDIIVSDIMMPQMDGNEMTRALKSDIRTSHIPIILLTAKDSLSDKEEGYNAGADSYLTKPFTTSLLRSRIMNLINARRGFQRALAQSGPDDEMREKREALRQSLSDMDKQFMDKLDAVIEQNISGDVDVDLIAQSMAVSSSTLYRKMKALTGGSTNEYIRRQKMRYAERLLLTGKYTISEISFMVGMNSVAYFRRCFKDEFGLIPSEYLKKVSNS